MKSFAFLAAAIVANASPLLPYPNPLSFSKVDLPKPLNWIADEKIFPGEVMMGFHSEISMYDAKGWAEYVLMQCRMSAGCTSTVSYSAINSGSTKGRAWFGYTFEGGPTNIDDYERDEKDGVEDSIAYTMDMPRESPKHTEGYIRDMVLRYWHHEGGL